ncbi:hypothetical protein GQ457_15G014880 [Hibiscus cannabinus]
MVSTPLHRGRQDLVVDQSCGDMRAAAVFRVDAIVDVSTPLHRGRQDLVVHQSCMTCVPLLSSGRNCQGVHSTPLRETGLGCPSILCDMRAAAVFRVDAIVGVSTPPRETRLGVYQLG